VTAHQDEPLKPPPSYVLDIIAAIRQRLEVVKPQPKIAVLVNMLPDSLFQDYPGGSKEALKRCASGVRQNLQRARNILWDLKNRHNAAMAERNHRYQAEIGAIMQRDVHTWSPYRILHADTEAKEEDTVYTVQWVYHFLGQNYVGRMADSTRERIHDSTKVYSWGDQQKRDDLIRAFWRRQELPAVSSKRGHDGSQIEDTPHTKRAQVARPLDQGNLATRLIQPKLDPMVAIHPKDEMQVTIPMGAMEGIQHKGIITVARAGESPRQPFLTANATRVRWLARTTRPMQRWRQWQSEAVERDQHNMVLSYQFLTQLRRLYGFDTIVGMHPLQAAATFPTAWLSGAQREGWTTEGQSKKRLAVVRPHPGHWEDVLASLLEPEVTDWRILMPSPIRDGALQHWLTCNATMEYQFPKGAKLLSQKNAWRQASLKTRAASSRWALWAPKGGAATLVCTRDGETRKALQNLSFTTAGTLPVWEQPEEEVLYGRWGLDIQDQATVAATDGSLLKDGRMGAAVTFLGDSVPECTQAVLGEPSSTTAELAALLLAVRHSPQDRPLIVLTDSHDALIELEHCQRTVFRKLKTPRESQKPLQVLVEQINAFAQSNSITFCKVRAHCGHLLNERADELAGQAALEGPSPEPQGPSLQCKFRHGDGALTQWNARLSASLVQEQARRVLRLPTPRAEDDDRDAPILPEETDTHNWLTLKGVYRNMLGQCLHSMDYSPQLKRLIQAISHSYPTEDKLRQWHIRLTATCPLGCGEAKETLAHAQCFCPCTKAARVAVHHEIWKSIIELVNPHLPPDDTLLLREATATGVSRACAEVTRHEVEARRWVEAAQMLLQPSQAGALDPAATPPDLHRPDVSAEAAGSRLAPQAAPKRRRRAQATHPSGTSTPTPAEMPMGVKRGTKRSRSQAGSSEAATRPLAVARTRQRSPARADHDERPHQSLELQVNSAQRAPKRQRDDEDEAQLTETPPQPEGPVESLGRQRPDGMLINWGLRRFYILEFTRANDPDLEHLARADTLKRDRYTPLKQHYQDRLPGWRGEVLPVTIGIRGTLPEAKWRSTLSKLGVPLEHHDKIAKAAIQTTLTGLETVFQARIACLQKKKREPTNIQRQAQDHPPPTSLRPPPAPPPASSSSQSTLAAPTASLPAPSSLP
jgi:ribonuclease HI